jgi:hypothetical protein
MKDKVGSSARAAGIRPPVSPAIRLLRFYLTGGRMPPALAQNYYH